MAYNSDGYIMLDFSMVDFRKTNQTIEGIYNRCVDVIGTNKFILVINANGRTPLPATCSFTNNQYVIDTCIYMFAISSNDNLFIRRNDVPASDIIDDSSVSVDKTWSSNKIDTELDGKADTSALEDYQPLLTAGNNITINDSIISADGIKKLEYIGNGVSTKTIEFPIKPKMLFIVGFTSAYTYTTNVIFYEVSRSYIRHVIANVVSGSYSYDVSVITYSGNSLTLTGSGGGATMNGNNVQYTVYYF